MKLTCAQTHQTTTRRRPGAPAIALAAALALPALVAIALADADGPAGQLARHLSLPADSLHNVIQQTGTLVDGTRVTSIKGQRRSDNAIIGVDLVNGHPVDLGQLRIRAETNWRAVNGALSPALVEAMTDDPGAQALGDLAVWYRHRPLERPDAPAAFPTSEQGSSADPGATGNDAAWPPKQGDHDPHPDLVRIPIDLLAQGQEQLAAANGRHHAWTQTVRSALAEDRAQALAELAAADVPVLYASDLVPLIVIRPDRDALLRLAHRPWVERIEVATGAAPPSLSIAREAQNVVPVNDLGYTGLGVRVAVAENGRIFGENPWLEVADYRFNNPNNHDFHATAVAGLIASRAPSQTGLARDVELYSAPYCSDVSVPASCNGHAGTDWAATHARVTNHSHGNGAGHDNGVFQTFDRQLDWIARFIGVLPVVSSGNFGAPGCGFTYSHWVNSPSRGYNAIAVGNYNDSNTVSWDDDAMVSCSSYVDPTGDNALGSHAKPEVAAIGDGTITLTNSTNPGQFALFGGTSAAAPMVSATAAMLIQAKPELDGQPAAIKAIVMASALHNIEGDPRLSDRDGAGGINGTSAIAVAERGHFDYGGLDALDLPKTYLIPADAGERVRFVFNWQSNPNGGYSLDRLPADIDVRAFRGDGTTQVAVSQSFNNPFEIVEFTAPAREIYVIRVELYQTWTGAATRYGAAWWRGVERLAPSAFFPNNPNTPTPLGHHYTLVPTALPPSNFWRGVALRPNSADYDLRLWNHSPFGNPAGREAVASSVLSSNQVDYILVDGNHAAASTIEHHQVYRHGGSGAFQINPAKHGHLIATDNDGTLGPFSLSATQAVFLADIRFDQRSMRRIRVRPAAGNNNDLVLALHRSQQATQSSWTQARNQAVVVGDSGGAGAAESLRFRHDGTVDDWLALAVVNKGYNTTASFYLDVTPSALFSDGFEGY